MMIYSGADTEAFLNEGDSDYLLVTFNEISFIANGSRYWGKPLIERNRINAIGIASRTPSWFLPSEISDICNRSRPILDRFKGRIVLSGHSMGAYGAIKYSGLFGASTVVATVPQYTIDRSILENDPRPPNPYFHPGRHRGMHPRRMNCPARFSSSVISDISSVRISTNTWRSIIRESTSFTFPTRTMSFREFSPARKDSFA